MTRFGAVAFFAAIFLASSVSAQPASGEDELRRHIAYLASDALEGRRPGSQGEALSAEYIARHFAEIGLEPGYEGGYVDHVALVDRRVGQVTLRIVANGQSTAIGTGQAIGFGRGENERLENLPVIFLGYGRDLDEVTAAALGLEGAVVVLLADQPGVGQVVAEYDQRRRQLAQLGAAAIVGLSHEEADWEIAKEMAERGRYDLGGMPMASAELLLSPEGSARLLAAAGIDFERVWERAAAADFEPVAMPILLEGEVSTGVFTLEGHNIFARLPGTGEGGEAVLYMAHHDHTGLCRPEGASDRICNGAIDNASGIAQLIEIAEGLAAGERPERDIYFLATTAEELGLLGAHAFVDDPPVPLERFVAAINLDTVGTSRAGSPLTTVGYGMTPIDPVIARVARELGRRTYTGEEMNAFVDRQDGKVLLDAGIPTVIVGGINAVGFQRFIVGPYHTPDDELTDDTDLSGAAEDILFHVALGRALADPALYRPPPR